MFYPVAQRASAKEFFVAFRGAILALITPAIIVGGIVGGFFTPTEASVVAVLYSAGLGCFVYRTLGRKEFAAVLEAGTNHPGEMPPLLRMIQPGIGVLTNIGREHLEFFGDLAGVAQEEGWLAELLPPSGKLFVNGDNEWTPKIVERARASFLYVRLLRDLLECMGPDGRLPLRGR